MRSFRLSYLLVSISRFAFTSAQLEAATPMTGQLGNASVVENNPPGVTYLAALPTDAPTKIKGSVVASANPDGIGVRFTVNFTNFPSAGGPFTYHLHVDPVPADGNCSGTLGHLDPFIRGEATPCEMSLPQTCQVGDLSGKNGKITSDPFSATYVEKFAATTMGIGSFFGNRSLVIHNANKTRLTCANFTLLQGDTPALSPNSSSPKPFHGSASNTRTVHSIGVLLLLLFSFLI